MVERVMGVTTTSKETVTMAIKRIMAVVAATMLEVAGTISKTKLSKKDANTLPKI